MKFHSLSFVFFSTLLHHTLLRLPVDSFRLLLLWRKRWWQHKQVLGRNTCFIWIVKRGLLQKTNMNFIWGIYLIKCTVVLNNCSWLTTLFCQDLTFQINWKEMSIYSPFSYEVLKIPLHHILILVQFLRPSEILHIS